MELFNSGGKSVTKTGVLPVTKSIRGLVFTVDKSIVDISAEKIKMEVERSGNNLQLTNGFMPLKDLFLLNTIADGALTCDENGNLQVIINLAVGGFLFLGEKETLKIEMEGLNSAKVYTIDTLEDFTPSSYITSYDRKTMAIDEPTKEFFVTEYAAMTIDNTDEIQEIAFRHVNGTVARFSMREFRALARNVDPVAAVDKLGAVTSSYRDRIQLPLIGIVSFEIRKSQTKAIDIYFRKN